MSNPSDFFERSRRKRLEMPAVVPEDEVEQDEGGASQAPPVEDEVADEDDEMLLHFEKEVHEHELVLDGAIADPSDELECDELEFTDADADAQAEADEDADADAGADQQLAVNAAQSGDEPSGDEPSDAAQVEADTDTDGAPWP